jgi:hypothetical protein
MALVAESRCASPITKLTDVISEVTGHEIRHELSTGWKCRACLLTHAFASAKSSPKISGDAEVTEKPSRSFVSRSRLQMPMLVAQTFEHRLGLREQVPALSH